MSCWNRIKQSLLSVINNN